MPLVRYEVRCEHSLANPELYRTVRDDSEGLLEGVAMAGLVGLVRQLGDLAEFASEIFHDLHDDVMKIVSRGKNLKIRVTRLEADLPVVEKALLAKASQFRFAYTARSKWRAPLPVDQNVCSQGELPRFVRSFYEECRGPPRLFLLDKFDGDGRGACVKRYTDPTFFRLTWATSQLEKAEQAERERQEQLELQAQQQKKSSLKKATNNNAGPPYPRERLSSAHFENLEGFTGDFTPELHSRRLDRVPEVLTDGDLTPDGPRSPDVEAELSSSLSSSPEERSSFQTRHQQLPEVDQGPVLAPLKIVTKNAKPGHSGMQKRPSSHHEEGASDDDEGASDYGDALTTMGSDVDSARLSVDSEHDSHFRFTSESDRVWVTPNHSASTAHVVVEEAQRQTPAEKSVERNQNDEFARRLGLKEPESPVAGTAGVVRESIASEAPGNGHANVAETVHYKASPKLPEKATYPSSRGSISLLDLYNRRRAREEEQRTLAEARDQSPVLESKVPQARQDDDQLAAAHAEPTVTTPGSRRRRWARDNGSQAQTSSILSLVDIDRRHDDGVDLASRLRARLLENSGTSSLLAMVPRQGEAQEEEQDMELSPGQAGYESSHRSSSNSSSPYTNISSSTAVEDDDDDGFTSESASASPKGPNFCTLLSPPESPPPRQARGLMGPPGGSHNTNSRSGRSSPKAPPPITPFLSSSPSISWSPLIKHNSSASSVDKVPQNYFDQASSSPKPPPLPPPPPPPPPPHRDTTRQSSLSPQTSGFPVASSAPSSDKDQASTLPNPVSRPRTWVDRSESNVAATLRAIRQAAAVASDDDTGSECRSDC